MRLQLGSGGARVTLRDVELEVNALNDLITDLPVQIDRGFIELVTATVPFRDLSKGTARKNFRVPWRPPAAT